MWKNIPFKGSVYFSVVLNLLLIFFVLIIREFLPPVVPFFYGLPSGMEQLTPSLFLIAAPVVGLFITSTNILISNFIKDTFLIKALIISSSFVSLLLAITVVKIVLLVGFF
jgi:hypothetical protein